MYSACTVCVQCVYSVCALVLLSIVVVYRYSVTNYKSTHHNKLSYRIRPTRLIARTTQTIPKLHKYLLHHSYTLTYICCIAQILSHAYQVGEVVQSTLEILDDLEYGKHGISGTFPTSPLLILY